MLDIASYAGEPWPADHLSRLRPWSSAGGGGGWGSFPRRPLYVSARQLPSREPRLRRSLAAGRRGRMGS